MRIIKLINNKRGGFTLLEVAIVIVIGGLIMMPFLGIYTLNKKREQIAATKKEVFDMQYALQAYVATYGRLPCPADPSKSNLKSGWGDEIACPLDLTASPSVVGVKSVTTALGEKVWIGAIPVNAINLSGDYSADPWGGRYTYAVSRRLTVPGSIPDPDKQPPGSISVVDQHGANVLASADTGRFVIVSHGINRVGAYTAAGVATACPTANSNTEVGEGENCDSGDSKFLISVVYNGQSSTNTDDFAISDMTLDAEPLPPDAVVRCDAKGAFYAPTSTYPLPDAYGCVFPSLAPVCVKMKPFRCFNTGRGTGFQAYNNDGSYFGVLIINDLTWHTLCDIIDITSYPHYNAGGMVMLYPR